MFFDGELLLDYFAIQLLLFPSLGFIFPASTAWLLVLFAGNPSKGSSAGRFFTVLPAGCLAGALFPAGGSAGEHYRADDWAVALASGWFLPDLPLQDKGPCRRVRAMAGCTEADDAGGAAVRLPIC